MGEIYVSSDWHYRHSNIIRGTSNWKDKTICRDYDSVLEHDEDLIERINDTVKIQDTIYFVGDWSFGGFDNIKEFRDRILCNNIHVILGNHDHHIRNNEKGVQGLFKSVNEYLEVSGPNGKKYIMFHYPMESWNGIFKGNIHLFAHQHSDRVGPGRKMDVGIDKFGKLITPYHIEEINDIMNKIPITGGKDDSPIDVK